MDLTRLYNLTTPELREEAERSGVGDTYAMSRGQLIHAIRGQASGQPSTGFLGKVVGFAKWALQAAQEEAPRKDEASSPPPGQTPGLEAETGAVSASEPVSGPVSEPVSASVPVPVLAPGPVSAPAPVAAPAPASVQGMGTGTAFGTKPAGESEPTTESAPSSRPPVGVFSKSVGMFEEPFPTRTMARILAEQGHFKRALAIYAGLLREEPGDRELSAEADGVRARSRARRPQAH